MALGLLVLFGVEQWDVLRDQYCFHKLNAAQTYEEARPWLEAIEANADSDSRTREAITSLLGPKSRMLTFWFFSRLDLGETKSKPLAARFARALGERETLARCWSHFVRWSKGPNIWADLDQLEQLLFGPPDLEASALESFAIRWFLGGSPIPPADPLGDGEPLRLGEISRWPFVYDDQLGRCRPDPVRRRLVIRKRLSERGLPIETVPLPGWEGAVPALPVSSEPSKLGSNTSLNWSVGGRSLIFRSLQRDVLYDGVWPRPDEPIRGFEERGVAPDSLVPTR